MKLTLKDKANRIEKWCMQTDCDDCPLREIEEDTCYKGYERYPSVVARNYDLIFKEHERVDIDASGEYQQESECVDAMLSLFGKAAVIDYLICKEYECQLKADRNIKLAEWYSRKARELRRDKGDGGK